MYASVFEDDFSSGDFTNWTTYNVTGSQQWEVVSFGNPAPSAKMSGYSGGARVNEDWLISKAIDLSASSNVFFIFDSVKRYSGDDIKVFYATDYAGGNPNSDCNGHSYHQHLIQILVRGVHGQAQELKLWIMLLVVIYSLLLNTHQPHLLQPLLR